MDQKFHRQTYNYNLDDRLIAQEPLAKRDNSRLLMADRNRLLGHHRFLDLPELLPHDSLLVMNNSKVFPSRLFGKTEHGGKVEVFLIEELDGKNHWTALAKPMKKLKAGSIIYFESGGVIEVLEKPPTQQNDVPLIKVSIDTAGQNLNSWLSTNGIVPLPPYINRTNPSNFHSSLDRETYQTVYADKFGSAAAPTAGLHFSENLIESLTDRGTQVCFTTLHIGTGTFLPVKSDDIRQHNMHEERYSIPAETIEHLIEARENSRPIIAVGTTALRSLEAFARLTNGAPDKMRKFADDMHRTNLFIHPGDEGDLYNPSFAKGMITNFHQPESTLLILICALMGTEHTLNFYTTAMNEEYRFLSYGDACLLWFQP